MGNNYVWILMTIILSLVAGGLISWLAFPQTITQIKEIAKEVKVPYEVAVPYEVIKEVLVIPDYKQQVTDALISEVSKDKDFRECEDDRYDEEEIAVKRIYDGFTLTEDNEDEISISDVRIKLNYDDGKCYRTFVCSLDAEEDLSCE